MEKIEGKEYFKVNNPYNILYLHKLMGVYINPYRKFEDKALPIINFGSFKILVGAGEDIYLEYHFKDEYESKVKELLRLSKNIIEHNE